MKREEVAKMHPADVADMRQAQREARQHGAALLKGREKQLARLVTTYADKDAQEMLEQFREWFWGTALPARVAKAKRARRKAKP